MYRMLWLTPAPLVILYRYIVEQITSPEHCRTILDDTIVFTHFDNSKEEEKFLLKKDYSFLAERVTLLATFATTDNFKFSACHYCILRAVFHNTF